MPWDIYDFTTASQFRRQLSRVTANGGGDEPESVLDAMYIALNSDWRSQRTHKTVVLMTDADTHPNLHERTSTAPIGGVAQIIQLIQETPHVMLFIVAPEYEAYQQIQRAAFEADRKVIFNPVPDASDDNRGLVKVNIRPLMEMISRVVSATSIDIASRFGDTTE